MNFKKEATALCAPLNNNKKHLTKSQNIYSCICKSYQLIYTINTHYIGAEKG